MSTSNRHSTLLGTEKAQREKVYKAKGAQSLPRDWEQTKTSCKELSHPLFIVKKWIPILWDRQGQALLLIPFYRLEFNAERQSINQTDK